MKTNLPPTSASARLFSRGTGLGSQKKRKSLHGSELFFQSEATKIHSIFQDLKMPNIHSFTIRHIFAEKTVSKTPYLVFLWTPKLFK